VNAPDVEHLLSVIDAPALRYREVRARERAVTAAGGRVIPLSRAGRGRRVGPSTPWTVAVTSPVRGAGCTTVAANLACTLEHGGWRVVAADMGAGQDLWRRGVSAATRPLHVFAEVPRSGWDGAVADVWFDGSTGARDALLDSDEVLVVVPAGEASFEALSRLESALSAMGAPARRFLVNGYDGRRRAHRDAVATLRGVLGGRVYAFAIQSDEAVRAAVAARRPVREEEPSSQVVADFEALAGAVAAAAEGAHRGGGALRAGGAG
jgi:hypothetical protein